MFVTSAGQSVASYRPPCLQEVAISRCAASKCHVPVRVQLNPPHSYLGSNNFPKSSASTQPQRWSPMSMEQ